MRDGGHDERFTQLCAEYQHRILGYALRRTNDADDAADVVAEVFLVAWRRLREIPMGDEVPWLYGTARRVLANHHRGQRRRRDLAMRLRGVLPGVVSTAGSSGTASDVSSDDLEAVSAAFSDLRERDRELLTLIGWEDLSRDQVADVLGCSRAALRVRLHRARERFARALLSHGIDPGYGERFGRSRTSRQERPRRASR